MFLPRKPDEYVLARHYKNETCEYIFTLIGYACPYMQVTSQLFSPAHALTIRTSPYACAANNPPVSTTCCSGIGCFLHYFIQINSGIFSKNGFSYEYHSDFNQLAALYLKMLALKGRLSLRSKDDCIVRLWLRCDGCDFTLNKHKIHGIYLVKYLS